ncbi:hypothetical protein MMC32_001220 [Xylographa parallela]|nr:hypothetical protein [Xylographa parallela]
MACRLSSVVSYLKVFTFFAILLLPACAALDNPVPRFMRALSSERYAFQSNVAPLNVRASIQPVSELPDGQPQAPLQIPLSTRTPSTSKYAGPVASHSINSAAPPKSISSMPPKATESATIQETIFPQSIPSLGSMPMPGLFEAGSMMFTGDPTVGFDVAGTTIHPGGPPVTVSGNIISLQHSGKVVIDGSSKQITTVTVGPVSQPKFSAFLTQTTGGAVIACIPELTTLGKSTITQCRGSWQSTIRPGTAPTQSGFPTVLSKTPTPTHASGLPISAKSVQSTKQVTTGKSSTFPKSAIPIGRSGSTQQSPAVIQSVSTKTSKPVVPTDSVILPVTVKPSGLTRTPGSAVSTGSSNPSDSAKTTGSVVPSVSGQPIHSIQSGPPKSSSITLAGSTNTINSLDLSGIPNPSSRSLLGSAKSITTGVVSGVRTAKSGSVPSTYRTRPGSPPSSQSASKTNILTKSTSGSQFNVIPSAVLEVTASNGKVTTTLISALSITTTIMTTPPGFSASTTSNPAWTSDTVATISGTMYPVLVNCGIFCGPPGSAVLLSGLGGLPSDPVRPGCGGGGLLGLFRSIFSCGTLFNFGSFPSFTINIDGIPEPEPGPAQNPNPNSEPNPSPSGSPTGTRASNSASTSSCKSTAITTCTQKVGLITSISGTSTTVRSRTSSECTTITACSGHPITIATTTGSVTSKSSVEICDVKCTACLQNNRPTGASPAKPPMKSQASKLPASKNTPQKGLSNKSITKLMKRAMVSPTNYGGDVQEFLLGEYSHADWVNLRQTIGKPSSALLHKLVNSQYDMVVQNLYGCTSVVVVSERAVWMAHFWEGPSFTNGQQQFETEVLNTMVDGDGTSEMPGIKQYTTPNNLFGNDAYPQTLVITPRNRNSQTPGSFEYGPMKDDIVKTLRNLFPGNAAHGVAPVEPIVIDYLAIYDKAAWLNTATGKILVQYYPDEAIVTNLEDPCKTTQYAMLKVWVEDRPQPVYQRTWTAEDQQKVADNQKRGVSAAACSQKPNGSTSPHTPTSGTATSKTQMTHHSEGNPTATFNSVPLKSATLSNSKATSKPSESVRSVAMTGKTSATKSSTHGSALSSISKSSPHASSTGKVSPTPSSAKKTLLPSSSASKSSPPLSLASKATPSTLSTPFPTPTCLFASENSFSLASFNGTLPLFCASNTPITQGKPQQLNSVDCSQNVDWFMSISFSGGASCPPSIKLADQNGALCYKIFNTLLSCQQPVPGIYSGGSLDYDCATWTLGSNGPSTGKECPSNTVPPIACTNLDDCKCPGNFGTCIKKTCYCNSTPVSVSLNTAALQTIEACFNDPIGCVLNNG